MQVQVLSPAPKGRPTRSASAGLLSTHLKAPATRPRRPARTASPSIVARASTERRPSGHQRLAVLVHRLGNDSACIRRSPRRSRRPRGAPAPSPATSGSAARILASPRSAAVAPRRAVGDLQRGSSRRREERRVADAGERPTRGGPRAARRARAAMRLVRQTTIRPATAAPDATSPTQERRLRRNEGARARSAPRRRGRRRTARPRGRRVVSSASGPASISPEPAVVAGIGSPGSPSRRRGEAVDLGKAGDVKADAVPK